MKNSLDIAFVASGDPRIDTFSNVASGGTGPIQRLAEKLASKGHEITIYAGTHTSERIESENKYNIRYLSTPNIGEPIDELMDNVPGSEYIVRPEELSLTPGEATERLFGRLVFSNRVSNDLKDSSHDLVYFRDRLSAFIPAQLSLPCVFTVVSPDACPFYYNMSVATHPANALIFKYKRAIERSVVTNADHTIVMNERTKQEYQPISNDISIVTLGVQECSFFDPEQRVEQPVILFVGRFDRNKRPEILIDALKQIEEDEWELHYVGSGPREGYVRELANNSPNSEQVRFHGHLPRSQVLERMRTASIFVLPSEFENCPNVIVEAMASGCPVIASDTMGAQQLITDGKTGLLFDKHDGEALQKSLRQLIQDEDRRRNIAMTAHKVALNRHTMDIIADKYLKIGRQAIEQHD